MSLCGRLSNFSAGHAPGTGSVVGASRTDDRC